MMMMGLGASQETRCRGMERRTNNSKGGAEVERKVGLRRVQDFDLQIFFFPSYFYPRRLVGSFRCGEEGT